MRRSWLKILPLLLGLLLAWTGSVLSQGGTTIEQMQAEGYDLLVAGKLGQAKIVFGKILQRDPDNPLALNNVGALLVKEKRYPAALKYLEKALPEAKDYMVRVNRVCDVEGICLAFRSAEQVYGEQELAPLVELNINMVKARLATQK
jgi:Flp pilus assembly protein TadD